MVAGVLRRLADGVGLLPALHRAQHAPQHLLRRVCAEAGAVDGEQAQQVADVLAVAQRQCPVHVGLTGVELRIPGQAGVQGRIAQRHVHRRAGALAAEAVAPALGVGQLEHAVVDKAGQQA